ncbi:hypothetical protein Rsub_10749 [Raphidocelis subcapitata]|uniref:AtC3H23-like CCCH zinc finger domain-containing protein n=1 Tax=Raphidocelis subcapitata TaxID=307507 RepID=A0A2V0PI49_9CHLO|nr:hypothetical protein Rsub_10749 [Raphidocelis subcapitata]|eukprot:GBF97613.1 hypothetical protein Rsub_10749 [Raphidocelis subcapitata]
MCYLGFPPVAPSPPESAAEARDEEAPKEREPCPYADEFMVWCFKVVECDNPQHTRDDWDTCPFAHVGEVVTRRPPQTHLPKLCPKARRACRKGAACCYAHNVFEHWLHPSRFKTEMCSHGARCDRPLCFFAHYDYEIRHPSPSADEVLAAAEAAGLLNRPAPAHAAGHGHGGGGCGRWGGGGGCYDSGSACSRRSSASNHDAAFAAAASAPWLAPGAAALAAALQQQQQQRQQQQQCQLYGQLSADLTFAAHCLQAQQRAQSAAAAAAASAGWGGADWSLLSSGGGSTGSLASGSARSHDAASPVSLSAGFGAPSPPPNPWAPAAARAHPPGLGPAALGAAGGLSPDDAYLLLAAGLPAAGLPAGLQSQAAASSYLCALQAEQARRAAAARFF